MNASPLQDARTRRRAIVFKAGLPAAILERNTRTGVRFAYLPEYVRARGPAIASTLPVLDVPLAVPHGMVPAYLAGLLPEGDRLRALRMAVGTTLEDQMSLLLAAGADPVGDVQVLPEGENPPAVGAIEPHAVLPEDRSGVDFGRLVRPGPVVDPIALPGVQDKASARLAQDPEGRQYILKVSPEQRPEAVADEYRLLRLAARLGIPTVQASLTYDGGRRPGLLVSRFDRLGTRRLAVEDGIQLLGLAPEKKSAVPGAACALAAMRRCASQRLAARTVFQQFLFAWLTGNGNLHARNLAVRQDPAGEWFIAPAFDLQCTLATTVEHGLAAGIPGGIRTGLPDGDPAQDPGLALAVNGKTTGLTGTDWLRFAADLDLPERLARTCMARLVAGTSFVPADLPFERNVSTAVIRVLQARREAMTR